MATPPTYLDPNYSNPFSQASSRLPEDTVFYFIYPDNSLSQDTLQSLHLQILNSISPFTSSYIWQHDPFTLTTSFHPFLHLHGHLRFGDNLNDEWFNVFLLFQISLFFPSLSIHVHDSDGEFLLIESAYHLPRWLNPENSQNRAFIRRGKLHIIPKRSLPNPTLTESLNFLIENEQIALAPDSVQSVIQSRIAGYPEKAKLNTHTVRVRVPVSVARVLKHAPSLISLAVEGFYDRDIDSMKHAAKMERFLKGGKEEEEMITVAVKMSRAMFAQLMQQKFQAPKCYPMPNRTNMEAELGMKIACGFEMMYQEKRKEGEEGKGSSWKKYKESLEKSGYFKGLIPGSKEYKRLMENAEEYYRNSSLFSKTSEMLIAPVRQIDEILSLPYSADDFKDQDIPPSDDDSWLYSGEDELNSALDDRQKEMELYELKCKKKKKSKEQQDAGPSSSSKGEDFDLSDLVKNMQGFIHKISSYEGAEVPEDRDPKEVELDVERFIKDMESVIKYRGGEDVAVDVDDEEGSSNMDFDESEDGSDISDHNEDGEDSFMHSYSDAMNAELKNTTLKKSFIHANEQPSVKNEGTSNATEHMDEEFTPVDVDVNLVKNLLDSFSSQQGLPGPTSNLLGLMGVELPKDDNKGK
ncbi:hypothetical protein CRYUN_Cryun22dG0079100 [Craigia yunnanensis]